MGLLCPLESGYSHRHHRLVGGLLGILVGIHWCFVIKRIEDLILEGTLDVVADLVQLGSNAVP